MINQHALEDLLSGLCSTIMEKTKKDLESSTPCIVTEVYEGRTKVDVRPLIKVMGADESQTSRAIIKGIPIETIGAGGMLISFPVVIGDLGWLQASDRDISLFLQSYADSRVPTMRKHSFSDARFIPDIMRNFVIASEDSEAVTIQNRVGTVKIALDNSEVRITAPSIKMNGAQITSGGDVVTASGISLDNHSHAAGTYTAGGDPVSGEAGAAT